MLPHGLISIAKLKWLIIKDEVMEPDFKDLYAVLYGYGVISRNSTQHNVHIALHVYFIMYTLGHMSCSYNLALMYVVLYMRKHLRGKSFAVFEIFLHHEYSFTVLTLKVFSLESFPVCDILV